MFEHALITFVVLVPITLRMSPSWIAMRQKGHVGPVSRPDDSSFSIHRTRHAPQLRCWQADRTAAASSSQHMGQRGVDAVEEDGGVDGPTSSSASSAWEALVDMTRWGRAEFYEILHGIISFVPSTNQSSALCCVVRFFSLLCRAGIPTKFGITT